MYLAIPFNLGSPMYIVRLEAVFLHSALKQTPREEITRIISVEFFYYRTGLYFLW
jgi:hypothetical protein